MSEWQSIESAPRDGTVILLWACDEDEWEDAHDEGREPDMFAFPARTSVQKSLWWIAGGMLRQLYGATHWMPLPTPPITNQSEAEGR